MRQSNHNWFTCCAAALLAAAGIAAAPPAQDVPNKKTAGQVFKNIQVLQGIPAVELIPAMQFINSSLGVQCDFCHLENAFDKDDKEPKQTARKMIRMMLAINQANFSGEREVTCYACHRGARKPVATPLIAQGSLLSLATTSRGEASSTVLPSVDAIVEKFLHATGGAQTARSVTRQEKGVLVAGPAQFPLEILARGFEQRLTTIHFPNGDSATGFNQQGGWQNTPDHGAHALSAGELAAARLDAYIQFGLDPRTTLTDLQVQSAEKVGDHDIYLLSGKQAGRIPVQLYFDQKSGFLVRLLAYEDTPLGFNPVQIDYEDYRDAGGLEIPFRWTIARPGRSFSIEINQVLQDVAISDEKFANPVVGQPAKP